MYQTEILLRLTCEKVRNEMCRKKAGENRIKKRPYLKGYSPSDRPVVTVAFTIDKNERFT